VGERKKSGMAEGEEEKKILKVERQALLVGAETTSCCCDSNHRSTSLVPAKTLRTLAEIR